MKQLIVLNLALSLAITFAGAQTAYISNKNDNNVMVVNTSENMVTATIPVGIKPSGVAVSPDGSKVFVTNSESGDVRVINTAGNIVTATIDVGDWPTGIAVSPDGSKVFVANSDSDDVSVINTADNTVAATIDVGDWPISVVVSPDGLKGYVANYISSNISVINTADNTVTTTIDVGSKLQGIAISPDGSKVFVINYDTEEVLVINASDNMVIATISIGSKPQGIAVCPDGSKVFVTNSGSDNISVINATDNTVTTTIDVGGWPIGVAVSPDGSKAYVANWSSDNVSVINTADNTVEATIPVGDAPTSPGNFISTYPVVFSSQQPSFCSNDGEQTGLGGGEPIGGIYSGSGVTDDGNGTTFSFAPQETGPGIHIISYTINGVPAKKGIQVLAVPDVSLTLPGPITVNDTPVILTGGMPGGGIYSGIGISGDSFDPMEAGLGTHTITYTYTDANGCSGIASGTITVKNPPPPDNFCDGANDINSLFGQAYNTPQASGLWDNTEYTSDGDPAMGYECFDDEGLQHTIWYTFTGDGNTYSIRTVQCNAVNYINEGETQVAVYSGDCDNLTAVACNEDESTSTGLFNIYLELPTEIGVNYLMMIDGFEEPGFIADGEFCLEITNLTPDAVTDIQRKSIHIFPNPTEGKLSLNGVEAYRVDIHDWLGRKVAKFEQPVGELDISNLPAGVYLLRIDTKNGTKYSARVVKNK